MNLVKQGPPYSPVASSLTSKFGFCSYEWTHKPMVSIRHSVQRAVVKVLKLLVEPGQNSVLTQQSSTQDIYYDLSVPSRIRGVGFGY